MASPQVGHFLDQCPFSILYEQNIGMANASFKVQMSGTDIQTIVCRTLDNTRAVAPSRSVMQSLLEGPGRPSSHRSDSNAVARTAQRALPDNQIIKIPTYMLQIGFPELTAAFYAKLPKSLKGKTKVLNFIDKKRSHQRSLDDDIIDLTTEIDCKDEGPLSE
jgi:hypothetical protein